MIVTNMEQRMARGYGIFQLTQPNLPHDVFWNWQYNAYDAVDELNNWRSEAEEWYRAVLRTWGTPPSNWLPKNPSDDDPILPGTKGISLVDAENIVLYNGPKGLGKGRNVSLLNDKGMWQKFRASVVTKDSSGWHFHDNINHYVYFVIEHIDPDSDPDAFK